MWLILNGDLADRSGPGDVLGAISLIGSFRSIRDKPSSLCRLCDLREIRFRGSVSPARPRHALAGLRFLNTRQSPQEARTRECRAWLRQRRTRRVRTRHAERSQGFRCRGRRSPHANHRPSGDPRCRCSRNGCPPTSRCHGLCVWPNAITSPAFAPACCAILRQNASGRSSVQYSVLSVGVPCTRITVGPAGVPAERLEVDAERQGRQVPLRLRRRVRLRPRERQVRQLLLRRVLVPAPAVLVVGADGRVVVAGDAGDPRLAGAAPPSRSATARSRRDRPGGTSRRRRRARCHAAPPERGKVRVDVGDQRVAHDVGLSRVGIRSQISSRRQAFGAPVHERAR